MESGARRWGPMFVADALGEPSSDRMKMHFIDNTDPDGIARMLETLKGLLPETLVIVTSKSGGTPDTRNGMVVVADAYREAHLNFARHAVAVHAGRIASRQAGGLGRLAGAHSDVRLDWRAHQRAFRSGTASRGAAGNRHRLECLRARLTATPLRACTKRRRNPAALMALMWYVATDGKGKKDMVVLPYKDRLLLFSRYLQQLVMESLGQATRSGRSARRAGDRRLRE